MSNLIERQDGNPVRKMNTLNLDIPHQISHKTTYVLRFWGYFGVQSLFLHSQQKASFLLCTTI